MALPVVLVVPADTSIEAALEPVKLFERIGKGGRDIGQQICYPTPLPGLAGHQRPHSAGSI
jgi:hypothetical protein